MCSMEIFQFNSIFWVFYVNSFNKCRLAAEDRINGSQLLVDQTFQQLHWTTVKMRVMRIWRGAQVTYWWRMVLSLVHHHCPLTRYWLENLAHSKWQFINIWTQQTFRDYNIMWKNQLCFINNFIFCLFRGSCMQSYFTYCLPTKRHSTTILVVQPISATLLLYTVAHIITTSMDFVSEYISAAIPTFPH